MKRQRVELTKFNPNATLPYNLRVEDFQMAMQDVYDFFYDVNALLAGRGLQRLDDLLRPAAMSGVISDMLTASLGKHSRSLTDNLFHNGHPDLIVKGIYPDNKVQAGTQGIEVKSTRNPGGCVDTHGARDQCLCVFVYQVDVTSEPARDRMPMTFTKVMLAEVSISDFRRNERGELGTRTASPNRSGMEKLRANWIYRLL
jgi:hypothetical protein